MLAFLAEHFSHVLFRRAGRDPRVVVGGEEIRLKVRQARAQCGG